MKSITKQTYTIALSALMIVFTLTLAGSSYANWQGKKINNNPELLEKKEAIHKAIESGDYDEFKSLAEQSERGQERLSKITPENFSKFSEAHLLIKEGHEKIEAGHEILKELGIDHKSHRGNKPHKGGHRHLNSDDES